MAQAPPPSIQPRDLALRLRDRGDVTLLDVREAPELEIAALPGALCIPMNELPSRLDELPREGTVAVLCHHGVRSFMVAAWLLENGFDEVLNVEGGIDAWSHQVDSDVPRY